MSADDCRPALLCRGLLAALDASEGRRVRRKRDTTPDAIGLEIKRTLLDSALREDPEPAEFEGWLLARCLAADGMASVGATRMMALEILAEWRLAQAAPESLQWLACGAPSEDTVSDGGDARDGREGPKVRTRSPAA